jgi:hypothetical protein
MKSQRNPSSGGKHSAILSLKQFRVSFVALAFTAFLLLIAFAPLTIPAKALDWEDAAIVISTAEAGMAIGSALGDGIGCIIGTGLGALAGAIIVGLGGNTGPAYGEQAKEGYAQNLKNVTQSYLNLAHTNAVNPMKTIDLSEYFFARKAEWAAKQLYDYQTAHSLAHVYDSAYVLSKSEVSNGTVTYIWNAEKVYESIFEGYQDLSQNFVGDYDGMYWALGGSGSGANIYVQSYADSNPYVAVQFNTMLATNPSSNEWLYLPSTYALHWVCGVPGTYTPTIKNSTGDVVWTHTFTDAVKGDLYSFSLDSVGLDSGKYQLSMSHSAYAFNYEWFGLASKSPTNSGSIYPGIEIWTKSGENAQGALFAYYDSGGWQIYPADNLNIPYFKVIFGPTEGQPQYIGGAQYCCDLNQYALDVKAIIDRTASTLSTANGFGQAYYNFLVAHAGVGNPPAPDIIFPDPSQMANMTWQQIYAIYLAYMNSLQSWFYNYSHMGTENISLSLQSMDLICLGSIYNSTDVQLYNETTVFTPFISLTNMTLELGINEFTQPGFFILWGNSTDLSQPMTSQSVEYVPFSAGWYANISEIYYQNESVETCDLNVTKLVLIIPPPASVPDAPQGISDMQWLIDHWYLIAGVLGIVLLMAALAVKRWEIALFGAALIVAAVLGYYMAGGLSGLGSLFGFELGG